MARERGEWVNRTRAKAIIVHKRIFRFRFLTHKLIHSFCFVSFSLSLSHYNHKDRNNEWVCEWVSMALPIPVQQIHVPLNLVLSLNFYSGYTPEVNNTKILFTFRPGFSQTHNIYTNYKKRKILSVTTFSRNRTHCSDTLTEINFTSLDSGFATKIK